MAEPLIQPLDAYHSPKVDMLRLDRFDALAPGNKWFKLRENIAVARKQGARCLVSLGGAYSNHLHALAAWGHHNRWPTAAFIRADEAQVTPCMADLRRWGMRLVHLSRSDYRRRHDPEYIASLLRGFDRPYFIPEGGANALGASGCADIAALLPDCGADYSLIVTACGTGATLAGLASAVAGSTRILGIPVLKAEAFMARDIAQILDDLGSPRKNWHLDHRFAGKGFGRVSDELSEFILRFEAQQRVPLDPVYTAKLCFAVDAMHKRGELAGESRVLVIHSGGLQGRSGHPALFNQSVLGISGQCSGTTKQRSNF
ncbi:pyridoxal-phosphate dependent enzyme [Spongiibacter marinus]|uniref:pyridoxal-phosphate dependent enzyme n=1 Tax=Spongiibacter marinus TaxID=354246 RepID=UPI00196162E6|nr:1-aminocyclopropane-1-carboxylate deaminase [Spongiibacter marinus]